MDYSRLALLIGFFFVSGSFAQPDLFKQKFDRRLKESGLKAAEVGIWIASPTGDSVFFEHHSAKSMIPASLSKVFTAAGVLKSLPTGYKFKTELAIDAEIAGTDLKGDLYLKGGGDPSFVSESMWFLVNEFRRTGIQRIKGNIIVDDSRFDQVQIDLDRQSVRNDRAYDAPVSATSMNWNSASIYVRPGTKAGQKCAVFVDIETPYLQVQNNCITSGGGKKNLKETVHVERRLGAQGGSDLIVVSGRAPEGADELVVYKNISSPSFWMGSNLREFLRQRDIKINGEVRLGRAPSTARTVAFSESKPIVGIVADMNKWSNNYVAEMLTKAISAESGESPATMATGVRAIVDYVRSLSIKDSKDDFTFVNPAGFTRENRVTPRFLGQFLARIEAEYGYFPEFLASLPIAGVDGTLRNRMKSDSARSLVRAKTGLLNGVAGLAGYAAASSGRPTPFVFLYNGAAGKEDQARRFFDSLIQDLVEVLK